LDLPRLDLDSAFASEQVVSEPDQLPRRPLYQRPDLRQVGKQIEKLLTFEIDIGQLGAIQPSGDVLIELGDGSSRELVLIVELRRIRSDLRGVIRLRVGPQQLALNFG
jgi:hypothetical protein